MRSEVPIVKILREWVHVPAEQFSRQFRAVFEHQACKAGRIGHQHGRIAEQLAALQLQLLVQLNVVEQVLEHRVVLVLDGCLESRSQGLDLACHVAAVKDVSHVTLLLVGFKFTQLK